MRCFDVMLDRSSCSVHLGALFIAVCLPSAVSTVVTLVPLLY